MTAVENMPPAPRSLAARVMRSSAITVMGFGASQIIRLASNLILTRLLFPEAFGMMAIVSVFLMGLAMFSDIGTGPAIMGSDRGDDPDFLNTAWTIQIGRGLTLWVVALALTWPIALWFGEPDLTTLLPVAAFTLVINGFNPTRLQTAHRHLQAGRVTVIEVATQAVGIIVAVALAWVWHSVWALVISGIVAALAHLVMLNLFLPGTPNRLRWDKTAASALIHFGKWVFLSTLCGFAIGQADKVLIGEYLSLSDFGLYNIAFFLASFPYMLGGMVMWRVLIPIFRESPPSASPANFAKFRKFRFAATGGLATMVALLAFGGVWLVEVMYDPRYHDAGGIVVLLAAVQMPALIILTCDQAALAAGDSRRFFVLTLLRAILVVAGLAIGLAWGGLVWALIGLGLANLAAYPALVWLLRPHGAWDPLHDAVYLALGGMMAALALWWNADAVTALATMHPG